MAHSTSKTAIVLAITGNAIVTVTKAIAWLVSGSGSMFSETMHSVADTLNQCMLLVGHRRSVLPPTIDYPYGFGPEANFWGLLAAIGILVIGGGLSLFHGIESLSHPAVPTNLPLVFAVLAIAFAVELLILVKIVQDLRPTKGERSWIDHIKAQGPGVVTVFFEDTAALMGAVLAAIAIGLCAITGDGIWDAVGQLVIGTMLVVVAVWLMHRNRGFLIGQSLPSERVHQIRMFLERIEGVDRITALKTRQLSAVTYTLKAELVFSGGYLAGKVLSDYLEPMAAADTHGEVAELLGRYSDRLMEVQALHVDWIEQHIQESFPGAVYIDLEPHLRDI